MGKKKADGIAVSASQLCVELVCFGGTLKLMAVMMMMMRCSSFKKMFFFCVNLSLSLR